LDISGRNYLQYYIPDRRRCALHNGHRAEHHPSEQADLAFATFLANAISA
jgi:hypothetical protein